MHGVVARDLLLALQGLQVTILAMGLRARAHDTLRQLLTVTAVQTLPFAAGLVCSAFFRYVPYPGWLYAWLWITYGALFLSQVQSWWLPYLIRTQQGRVRNRVTPNTMHLILHLSTIATLILLAFAR